MKPFYIVWNIHRPLPAAPIRHETREAAVAEAERLTQRHPDDTFYVMRLVSVTKLPKPPSITFYVDGEDAA